jgi:hypothetical protein
MIALLLALAQAAAAVPPSATSPAIPSAIPPTAALPLGPIGPQALPAKGCAAFLWSAGGDRQLVAMAVADPGTIRLALGGKTGDYQRSAMAEQGGFGFGGSNEYRGGDVVATLDLQIVTNANLTNGAQVPAGTLRVDRTGQDTLVIPVAGLIGCRG